MPYEVDQAIVERVTELCDAGDEDVEHGKYDEAIEKYQAALALVPSPVHVWRVTMWILSAMGEAYLYKKDYESAQRVLLDGMRVPGATASPFMHLRLGQAEAELGNLRAARDELTRALLGGGEQVFEGEDPKYLALARANLPEPQRDN